MSQLHSLQAKAALWRQQNMDSGLDVQFAPVSVPSLPAPSAPATPPQAAAAVKEQSAPPMPARPPVTLAPVASPPVARPPVTRPPVTGPDPAQACAPEIPDESRESIAPARAHEMLVLLLEQSALVRQHLENMRSLAQSAAATPGGATHTLAGIFARHAMAVRLIVGECSYGSLALMDKDRWLENALPGIATSGSGSYELTLTVGEGPKTRSLTLADYAELARSPLLNAPLEAHTAAERESSLGLAIKAVQLAEQGYTAQAARFEAMAAE